MINLENKKIPYKRSNESVVYHANDLPNAPNHYGYIKAVIGQNF